MLSTTLSVALALLIAVLTCRVFQQLVFHPLAKFPGPLFWRLSRGPYCYSLYHGNLVKDVLRLHERYGPIVRIAPDELSFTDPDAARDIYTKRRGQTASGAFQKNQIWVPTPPKPGPRAPSILNADDDDHARIRKAWSYGFSEKSLKAQEGIIHQYATKLIDQLSERVGAGNGQVDVDIMKWYNYCAFDIVGDLTFGESFGCLDRDEYHEWVGTIMHHFKAAIIMTAYKYYPWIHWAMSRQIPKESFVKQAKHFQWAKAKVNKRLHTQKDRPDFLSHLSKSREVLSEGEIEMTGAIVIIAGSNSLTTTLTGTTNYILNNPEVHARLAREVRSAFSDEREINIQALSQLRYLNAVIEEGLRMVTPVPLGMTRTVPAGGGTVCGHFLPGGTSVSYQSYAATHTERNFADPFVFRPERWIPGSSPNMVDRLDASQPFSLGPRSCLGRNMAYFELRLVLALMFRVFDISLPEHGSLEWTSQKTYATWYKEPFRVHLTCADGDTREVPLE